MARKPDRVIMEPLFDIEAMQADAARQAALGTLPAAWAALPDGPAHATEPTGKCLYDVPTAGFAGRVADVALWIGAYGHFGWGIRAHAWRPTRLHGHTPDDVAACQLARHDVVMMDCDLRRGWDHREKRYAPVPPCGHDADAEANRAAGLWRGLQHRAACRMAGCDWEGPVRDRESPAVEDGMDHAWAGWRNLPPVPRRPEQIGSGTSKAALKQIAAWTEKINAVYPAGWLEAGGPIRTLRRPGETRHVEDGTWPYKGYDLAMTCHLCGAAGQDLTWLTSNDNTVTVAGCKDGCPEATQ